MKLTYIGHSGFLAELEHMELLFDYYEGEIPKMTAGKPLFVFASHRHSDHFNPDIFQLTAQKPDVFFILSDDIWSSRVPQPLQKQTVRLKPGTVWEHDSLRVQTLKSTDEGVAFLIHAENHTLYHAGDLNDWRWAGKPEEQNRQMDERYRRFLEPLRGMHIDAAMVPLDPRQEDDYALGLDYFLELTDPRKVYPMHCWEDYAIIDRWFSDHPDHPKRDRIVRISARSEVFEQS